MVIVTGTKRSGTSMWMQLLDAAGFPVLGEKFMRNWESTIRDANPHGFYESILRRGIYYATNPHPRSGIYLRPEDTQQVAVKVFPPGLVRTDVAFIDHVIVTMRPWREYCASLERLFAMEDAAREKKAGDGPARPRAPRLEPHLEWWLDNYLLVRDIATRGYPARITTYHRILREPEAVLSEVFRFLGAGDVAAAVAAVQPETRTQHDPQIDARVDREHAALFDELFHTVDQGQGLSVALLEHMNEVHASLLPEIEAQTTRVREHARTRRRQRKRRDASLAAAITLHEDLPSTDDLPSSDDPAADARADAEPKP